MVLLDSPMNLSLSELQSFLREALNNPEISVQGDEADKNNFIILWGKMAFALMHIDSPIPSETFDIALRTSFGLQNGEQLVKAHKAHLIISPINAAGHQLAAIYNALGVMTLADLIREKINVLAHFWSASEILMDADQFKQALAGAESAFSKYRRKEANAWYDLPVQRWVGMRMISPDRQTQFGARTQGLAALTGFEIQIDPFPSSPQEVAKHLYGMASYALNHGPVFKDGDTIGISAEQQFRISRRADNTPVLWVMVIESTCH
ncbi:hypothetical protein OLMES_0452 [Oleiphilus messinensis]|uniref:DUF4261 domain-containing protein n=1 Tax=Oleiphilus messinensis TaxID=141451 RepID=A0A1Y0I443_9GAMM|nr:DUF4261 domain-containing protein [Oleiphilus messinensis]ARU54556.1 hypothetical protein OLMES_0452 [Oleiphilus messinensis]